MSSDALSQMIEALGLEVAAIRKTGGGSQAMLRGGERFGQAAGSWLYRFVVSEDLYLRDDTPVRVSVGQEDVPGIIVSFRDGGLVVALDKDLGPKVASARLSTNDAFLVEHLKGRLERVRSGEAQFCRPSAERALGLSACRTADAEPHPSVFLGDPRLNTDQACAVRRSLGSDTTFVWGPPGTGKTTTLARVVEAHYRAGKSVLLVSNTNIAVDTALRAVAERLKGESSFHQGLVIRQGPIADEGLVRKYGTQVVLEQVVARLGSELHDQKVESARNAEHVEAEVRALLVALTDHERLDEARRTLAELERSRDAAMLGAIAREQEAVVARQRASELRAAFERANAMGALRRLVSGLHPDRLAQDAVVADLAAQAAADAARALAKDVPRYEADAARLRHDIDGLAITAARYPPALDIRARAEAARARLDHIRQRVATIDRDLGEIEQQVIARCRILATTVYRTYLGKSAPRQFDAVVIDEASMLMPPLTYYVAGLATQSVTVAGDFRQLPPIVTSDEALAERWLKRDVFEIAGIPERVDRRQSLPCLVELRVQHRMREQICAVINAIFYGGTLITDPSTEDRGRPDRPVPAPLLTAPLAYVDTSAFQPWAAMRVGTHSRYNLFHALLVRNVVLGLRQDGFRPREGAPDAGVGAIAPYAAQARLIQALIEDRLTGDDAAGTAATVHRFQGRERAAIVLDLTDSIGARLGSFYQATRIAEDGARLLNVAVSRAQLHVVLVGNFEYLRAKAPRGSIVLRIVDHFQKHGQCLDASVVLPITDRDWERGLHIILPPGVAPPPGANGCDSEGAFYTEGTFYPAFLKDIAGARTSIVILSPFATEAGTSRWMDPIRAALRRGVRVRVLTKPPEEFGGGRPEEGKELVNALRCLGVTVDLRAKMHEKAAIVDDAVLWHGSLNMLSHSDTHESMYRVRSPKACTEFGRFISAPSARGAEGPGLHVPENPECPTCGGPTVWNDGRFGVYFECERTGCAGKVDARQHGRGTAHRAASSARGARTPRGGPGRDAASRPGRSCPQPGCGGRLAERTGRHGRFLGCTKYPNCRYTENL